MPQRLILCDQACRLLKHVNRSAIVTMTLMIMFSPNLLDARISFLREDLASPETEVLGIIKPLPQDMSFFA